MWIVFETQNIVFCLGSYLSIFVVEDWCGSKREYCRCLTTKKSEKNVTISTKYGHVNDPGYSHPHLGRLINSVFPWNLETYIIHKVERCWVTMLQVANFTCLKQIHFHVSTVCAQRVLAQDWVIYINFCVFHYVYVRYPSEAVFPSREQNHIL